MLSIGGWDPTLAAEFTPVDPWKYGIGIFDITLLRWQTYYNSLAGPMCAQMWLTIIMRPST
jgi:hypothetical protein